MWVSNWNCRSFGMTLGGQIKAKLTSGPGGCRMIPDIYC